MNQIEASTCVRFVERKQQDDYLVINSSTDGCSSKLGKIGGGQKITLGPNCFRIGNIMHVLIHSLGYTHMHNHIDRDRYVTVNWNNIKSEYIKNFNKVNLKKFGNYNTPYDYHSVMHYGTNSFAKSGLTMVPKISGYADKVGQRSKLSKGDKRRINNMYKCKR